MLIIWAYMYLTQLFNHLSQRLMIHKVVTRPEDPISVTRVGKGVFVWIQTWKLGIWKVLGLWDTTEELSGTQLDL